MIHYFIKLESHAEISGFCFRPCRENLYMEGKSEKKKKACGNSLDGVKLKKIEEKRLKFMSSWVYQTVLLYV